MHVHHPIHYSIDNHVDCCPYARVLARRAQCSAALRLSTSSSTFHFSPKIHLILLNVYFYITISETENGINIILPILHIRLSAARVWRGVYEIEQNKIKTNVSDDINCESEYY